MNKSQYLINSQIEMRGLAKKFARNTKVGDIIGLKGTLGSGKTFFSNAFINSLLDKEVRVISPTFGLVCSYQTPSGVKIHHFDLYRLKSEEELENIGFFDYLEGGICLIEWPEIAERFLKKNYLEIKIEIQEEEKRLVSTKPYSDLVRPKFLN